MSRIHRWTRTLGTFVALLVAAAVLQAQVPPEKLPLVAEKAFQDPALDIPAVYQEVGELPSPAAAKAREQLASLNVAEASARIDKRSGRFATLLPTTPLLPGRGVGNNLRWSDLGTAVPGDTEAVEALAWNAFHDYLLANQESLGIDAREIAGHRIAAHGDGELVQIYVPRSFDGIPVRDSHISAVIGQGNLILWSAHQWGDRGLSANREPISQAAAQRAVEEYLIPLNVTREWGKAELVYVPMARGAKPSDVAQGKGYRYQLVWSVKVEVERDRGSWELLVDAHTGDVLANADQNHYAEAVGGVYPVTNDGLVPDGVEQAGWPMPFMEVGSAVTDTGGNYDLTGSQTARLYGPYVNMSDNCGTDSLTQSGGIDWGTSGGTDCTTPGFGGAGNTHASRTGFYELNKLKEMARSQLPSNSWLQGRLTSNMNINSTCNAFWNGSTINFYRSGGGCSNTGEIAGVFDHEWGHGMDANDVVGGIASPSGEGIADIYTALRLNDSCIGRNFRPGVQCSGNGDPCLDCTGVRDIDYLKHQSGQPHDYSWSNATCSGSVHCVGHVYSEAVWSLWKRELQSAPYNMDNNTAHEVVNRLTFLAAGNTSTWFSGGPPNGGCSGSSGYMNYLAADDDNGNLNDGTPHMTAIYNAFNDQEIACGSPSVQDSGCSGTPTTAPNVTATPGDNSVSLSWGSVSGASEYEVFRTEGVFACDFGKAKIGTTTGTSWNDSGLQNGRDYSYVVIAKGSSDACFGPASACDTVQPAGAPPTPDFEVSCTPSSHSVEQGQNATSTCTVTALNGYTGSVGLSCSGNPAGISCGFSPSSVSPTGNSTLTLTVDLGQSTGTFNFDVVGDDGTDTRTTGITVTVTPEGQNGPQDAVYDAALGAPKCAVPGSECDSTTLLDSRSASLSPAEPNQPNTLDGCTDGTSGTYHSDESNDRIVVRTLDGLDFAEGATVEVEATVWAWNTGSADTLDLYYAADANSPSWTLITSIVPSSGGANTLTAQYTLPAGSMQAVRAIFRYQGSPSSCGSGSYDDTDDLVFAVNSGAPECTINADCDDGLFCNGAETCNAGSCQAGSDPCPGQGCDEATDSCTSGGACSHSTGFTSGADGWTNGADTCNTGSFVVGSPDATAWQVSGGNPGNAYYTQPNPGGVGSDDVDGGTCEALSPVVDCTGQDAAEVTLDYFHGQRDAGDDAGDGFTIEVLNDGAVVDTLVAIGDVTNNPAWTTVSTTVNNPGDIQIRVRATDAAGGGDIVEGGIDNVTVAPATPSTCAVDDDLESGTAGWSNDPASTCTTGDYVAGNPTNPSGGYQIVGSHSGVTSLFTATNTSAGADDVDGGNCILGSPTWSVSSASTLSVWYWHGQRDAGDDASGDFFLLEYSTDGGSSWTTLASNGDSTSNPVWTNATAAIPAGSNVELRMQCSDGSSTGDLVECGLDDVSICN